MTSYYLAKNAAIAVVIFSHGGRKHFYFSFLFFFFFPFGVTNLAEGGKNSKDIRISMKIVNTFLEGDKNCSLFCFVLMLCIGHNINNCKMYFSSVLFREEKAADF